MLLQPPLARRSARSGDMNQRVTLQKRVDQDDGMGGRSKNWTDVATVWARVRPVASGGETIVAEQERAVTAYWVTINHRKGFGPADRVLWQDKVLNVRSATDPTERRQELLLRCEQEAQT